jgi:thiamine-phosphate pyrophosphorylase
MLIVISDSTFLPGEAALVNELFRSGMDLFHIRKYGTTEHELAEFIRNIDPVFYEKLVLNHHHRLGMELGLKRFHYSENDRKTWSEAGWSGIDPGLVYSTSVHSVEAYNGLPEHFSYAFLSPVFDSISKPDYRAVPFDFSEKQNRPVKLIGLGGIREDNVNQVFRMGFDGAAVLGTIWKSQDPVRSFCSIRSEIGGD